MFILQQFKSTKMLWKMLKHCFGDEEQVVDQECRASAADVGMLRIGTGFGEKL